MYATISLSFFCAALSLSLLSPRSLQEETNDETTTTRPQLKFQNIKQKRVLQLGSKIETRKKRAEETCA
jgi:hypothetical protein